MSRGTVRKVHIGTIVRLVCKNGNTMIGSVRKVSPRRLGVHFGDTGMGQKVWPFNEHGEPVGLSKGFFDAGLDLEWHSPFEVVRS
jgi:hypothetical protein